jgi:hypothetical protein
VRSRPDRPRRARLPANDPQAVAERRARSVEEPLDVQLRTADPYPLLEVRNPIHGTGYLVMLPEFPARTVALCTCTDFARRGLGTCKHIEAGVRWLSDHPDAPPLRPGGEARTSGLWKKIDQRIGTAVKDRAPPSRRWRLAGATLFEGTREE